MTEDSASPTPALRRQRSPLVAIAVAALVLAAVAFALTLEKTPAPNVALTTIDGHHLSTAQMKGKVVILNFWATSCTTCMHEMPMMVKAFHDFEGKGVEFVWVAMSYDPPEFVANYTKSRELPFEVAMDKEGTVAKAFGNVELTPTTFVIDKEGHIVKRYLGEPEFAELEGELKKELAG